LSARETETPDVQESVHVAHGLFAMMNLIDGGQVNAPEQHLSNIRHELALPARC
jgi:hypothetical protein